MTAVLLACLVTGVLVGWLAGLLGIGGGLIIVPVLSFLLTDMLNVPLSQAMPVAIATSLSTIIFTGFSSARAHYKLGNLDKSILMFTGLGVGFGAVIGAQIASNMDGEDLSTLFAFLVMVVAAKMLFGKIRTREQTPKKTVLGAVGSGAGILSAIMGIGGGAILVPALCWFGVALRTAIGSASASGLIVAIFGTASFLIAGADTSFVSPYTYGYVFVPATLSISVTSIFFAPMGAKFGQKTDTVRLKKFFACFLVIVSIRMIWGMS